MPTLTKSNQLVPRDERSATIVAPFPGFLLRYERFWRSAKDQARRSLPRRREHDSWLRVKPVAKAKTVQNCSLCGLWRTAHISWSEQAHHKLGTCDDGFLPVGTA